MQGRKPNYQLAKKIEEYLKKGLSYGEIGKIIGMDRSNVYRTVFLARKRPLSDIHREK